MGEVFSITNCQVELYGAIRDYEGDMLHPENTHGDTSQRSPARISYPDLPTPPFAIGFVVRWTVLSCASLGLASGEVDLDRAACVTYSRK